jgi:hypothetical protein
MAFKRRERAIEAIAFGMMRKLAPAEIFCGFVPFLIGVLWVGSFQLALGLTL